jgi:hypothetical protein
MCARLSVLVRRAGASRHAVRLFVRSTALDAELSLVDARHGTARHGTAVQCSAVLRSVTTSTARAWAMGMGPSARCPSVRLLYNV